MRLVYIRLQKEKLPNFNVQLGDDDNLFTKNQGLGLADRYFTCGDLVFNYNSINGEIISYDGYLPYIESVKNRHNILIPEHSITARLHVGDLTESNLTAHELSLEFDPDKKVLHAGGGRSKIYITPGGNVVIGLTDDQITDVYFDLSQKS